MKRLPKSTKKMPPGLRRYWNAMKAKRSRAIKGLQNVDRTFGRAKHASRKKLRSLARRMRNPAASFRLAIQKGKGKRLYLLANGQRFSDKGVFKYFHSTAAIMAHAKFLAHKFPDALRGHTMLKVSRGE